MKGRLPLSVIVLAAIGIIDAGYLSYAHYTNSSISCGSVFEGCNAVATSPYSVLFGVLPLAYLGLVFYIAVLTIGILLFRYGTREYKLHLLLITSLGIIFSAYFVYVQLFLIGALCIYCVISATLSVLLFLLAVVLYRREDSIIAVVE